VSEFVEVYVASDITFAYLVKAQLEDAGIPVQIANENLGGAYCLDGMVPRVLVPASRAEEAREIRGRPGRPRRRSRGIHRGALKPEAPRIFSETLAISERK
jgi:hypothetical protein